MSSRGGFKENGVQTVNMHVCVPLNEAYPLAHAYTSQGPSILGWRSIDICHGSPPLVMFFHNLDHAACPKVSFAKVDDPVRLQDAQSCLLAFQTLRKLLGLTLSRGGRHCLDVCFVKLSNLLSDSTLI
jgi:hypothetical protein